jgi:hypothetical protein
MVLVALRRVEDGDLDAFFGQMRDPEGVQMAAFTPIATEKSFAAGGTKTSRKPSSGWTPDGRTPHSSAAGRLLGASIRAGRHTCFDEGGVGGCGGGKAAVAARRRSI